MKQTNKKEFRFERGFGSDAFVGRNGFYKYPAPLCPNTVLIRPFPHTVVLDAASNHKNIS